MIELDSNPQPKSRKQIAVCHGQYCSLDEYSARNLERLKELLEERGLSDEVEIEISECMSMCGAGPNIILYPDDIVFHFVDEDEVERIVDEEL